MHVPHTHIIITVSNMFISSLCRRRSASDFFLLSYLLGVIYLPDNLAANPFYSPNPSPPPPPPIRLTIFPSMLYFLHHYIYNMYRILEYICVLPRVPFFSFPSALFKIYRHLFVMYRRTARGAGTTEMWEDEKQNC